LPGGGLVGQVRRGLAPLDDAALLDAGALHDPRVAGLHHPFQVVVGQHFLWRAGPCPDDACVDHFGLVISMFFFMSSWMCLLTSLRASSEATRIAFLMARSEDRPWLMMLMPLMPMSGAPPYSA